MKLKPFSLFAGIFLASVFAAIAHAQETASQSRWEKTIQAFEASDKENPPPRNAILFIGSSSIRGWRTLAEDFADYQVINRGFGGSQISDSVEFANRIILPYRPSMVVLYAGENDIRAGESPEQVAGDFVAFVEAIRAELPGTRIAFIAMKPSPSRWNIADKLSRGNRLIRDYISTAPGIDYIDIWGPMLNESGEPRQELFVKDNLHLNPAGYDLWQKIVMPYLAHHEAARAQKVKPDALHP